MSRKGSMIRQQDGPTLHLALISLHTYARPVLTLLSMKEGSMGFPLSPRPSDSRDPRGRGASDPWEDGAVWKRRMGHLWSVLESLMDKL